jgi:hypothetical protein
VAPLTGERVSPGAPEARFGPAEMCCTHSEDLLAAPVLSDARTMPGQGFGITSEELSKLHNLNLEVSERAKILKSHGGKLNTKLHTDAKNGIMPVSHKDRAET